MISEVVVLTFKHLLLSSLLLFNFNSPVINLKCFALGLVSDSARGKDMEEMGESRGNTSTQSFLGFI